MTGMMGRWRGNAKTPTRQRAPERKWQAAQAIPAQASSRRCPLCGRTFTGRAVFNHDRPTPIVTLICLCGHKEPFKPQASRESAEGAFPGAVSSSDLPGAIGSHPALSGVDA